MTPDIQELRKRLEAAASGHLPSGRVTVDQLVGAYLSYGQSRWTKRRGNCQYRNVESAVRPLSRLYGQTPAADFGAVQLRAIQLWLSESLSVTTVRARIGIIRRVFRFGVSRGVLQPELAVALSTVEAATHAARPAAPVPPVPADDVYRTLPFISGPVRPHYVKQPLAIAVEIMLLTGMRVGEALIMRGQDVDRSGRPWVYRPEHHKTAWRGQTREIPLGPRAQELLLPILRVGALFTSRFGKPYTVCGAGSLIWKACEKAGVKRWHLSQLRHTFAQACRHRAGIETVQQALGHRQVATSERYAPVQMELASRHAATYG